MTVAGIAWRSLRHRLLSTVLTIVGIALATALVLGTIALLAGISSVLGIDLPVGPILIILIGLAIIVRAFQPRW